VKLIAHRGGKGVGVQHSIATMQHALKMGAQGVAFDVWPTRDGHPVVIHSSRLEDSTDATGSVMEMTLDQTVEVHLATGEKLPKLAEVLNTFNDEPRVMLFIELKHPQVAMQTAELVSYYINNKGYSNHRVVIITALHQLLVQIKQRYPLLHLGAILRDKPAGLAAVIEYAHAVYLLPDIDILDDELMADALKRDAMVIPYVCDTPEQQQKARDLGCIGMILSDPSSVEDNAGKG